MALFGRKKQQDSILPEEVKQYYQAQKRERTGVVFILGIMALIATLLVGLGLFFGGRYLYQKVRGDKSPATTQNTSNQDNIELPQIQGNGAPETNTTPRPTPSTNDGTSTPQASPSQTPVLGDQPSTLPRTGDEGQ